MNEKVRELEQKCLAQAGICSLENERLTMLNQPDKARYWEGRSDAFQDAVAFARAALAEKPAERPQLSAEQVREAASYVTLRLPGKLNWDTSERTEHGKILHRLLSASLLTGEKVPPAMKGESNEPVQESLQSDAHPVLEAVQTYEETMRVANREDGRPVICSSAPAAPPVPQADALLTVKDLESAFGCSWDADHYDRELLVKQLNLRVAAIRREAERAAFASMKEKWDSDMSEAEFERWLDKMALADSPVSGERERKTE